MKRLRMEAPEQRLIDRISAARYVDVSPGTFDKMVGEGKMPKPLQVSDRRIAWDVRELDAAIDALPRVIIELIKIQDRKNNPPSA